MEKENEINSIVNSSTMLLCFEGWIKYIEGFSRGLQTTKTVDAITVFDCIGEIMEYMKSLKSQIIELLCYCETVLEKEETMDKNMESVVAQLRDAVSENEKLQNNLDELNSKYDEIKQQNEELRQAIKLLGEKNGKDM